jgi:hypothetical protein
MIEYKFFARAHGKRRSMNPVNPIMYTGRLPYISLIGAKIKLPEARPTR